MEVTRIKYELSTKDVSPNRNLKTSALFTMMQDGAVKSSRLMHADYDAMSAYGLIWVVALQRADIRRMPKYGEEITLETWPGKAVHTLMPRYYRFLDSAGEEIITGSALWGMVDIEERRMINPAERGIELPYIVTGSESARPRSPKGAAENYGGEFTVPFSYLDLNGHMNNCRYFDLAEDVISPPKQGKTLKSVTAEYSSEIKLGETVRLRYGINDGKYLVTGETDKPCFKIVFEYER